MASVLEYAKQLQRESADQTMVVIKLSFLQALITELETLEKMLKGREKNKTTQAEEQ